MKKVNYLISILSIFMLFSMQRAQSQTKVSTAQEFVDNAKSNSVVSLATDKIILSSLKTSSNPNISFETVFGSQRREVHIKNVHDLVIDGEYNSNWAELVTEPTYGNVLVFDNCKNITIKNITAGHGPEKGQCVGGVLKFKDCENIKIENTILYGSGTYGITAENTKNLECVKTYIKECTYGIIDFNNVQNFSFNNCKFKRNEGFDMLNIKNSTGSFVEVEVEGNKAKDGYLLNLQNSKIALESMFVEDNILDKGLCNDWQAFSKIDFFAYTIDDRPVDEGLAAILNNSEPDSRIDLQKKWRVENFKRIGHDNISVPEKPISLEFKADGTLELTAENVEKYGKYYWSPIGDINVYISNERERHSFGLITKITERAANLDVIEMNLILSDIAHFKLRSSENTVNETLITEHTEELRFVSTELLMEGDAMITFKNENGGFLNFVFAISEITELESEFVKLNSLGQTLTKEENVGKTYQIDYEESEYEDPNTGGAMTLLKMTNVVEVITVDAEEIVEEIVEEVVEEEVNQVVVNKVIEKVSQPHVDDKIGQAVKNNNLAHFIRTNSSYQYISTDGKLTTLRLDKKGLTTLPANLKELTDLEELDITANSFTEIPEVIFEMNNLKVLKISKNKISIISDNISKLNSLTAIYASENLIKEIPASIGGLNSIRVLDFSKNKITAIAENIGKLSAALYDLDLSFNSISRLPESIGNCTQLTHLNLGNNDLQVLPSEITNLSKMKVLKLNDNNLTSLPADINKLSALKKLWLEKNSFVSLPSSMSQLSNLKEVGKAKEYSRTKAEKKNTEAFIKRVSDLIVK